MPIKIVLVDDHKLVREGLQALIEKDHRMEVIGEAEDGRTAVKMVLELLPDVVVIDISMPGLNGVDATRQIISAIPKIKVIALSVNSSKRFVKEMFKAGAKAYLVKDCAFEELRLAINTVIENHTYLSPCISDVVIEDYTANSSGTNKQKLPSLTQREREVLQLIVEGHSTKEIASHLYVSVNTIDVHRRNIMNKLKVNNLAQLIKYTIQEELTFS